MEVEVEAELSGENEKGDLGMRVLLSFPDAMGLGAPYLPCSLKRDCLWGRKEDSAFCCGFLSPWPSGSAHSA